LDESEQPAEESGPVVDETGRVAQPKPSEAGRREFAEIGRRMMAEPRQREPITTPSRERVRGNAGTWQLRTVPRTSMADGVLLELRDAIVDGRIAQGDQLREVQLARTFGTGRGVVREALRQLVQEGLVEYLPHRGAFVRLISTEDILDVYTAREALESGAARRVLQSEARLDLSALRRALEQLREAAEGHDRVTEAMISADVDFHRAMVALARSPRMIRAHETLMAETRMLLRHQPIYPASDYVRDHARLLDAFERRDPRTPELVAEHLQLSARLIRNELERENVERNRRSALSASDGG
jgi:DNA-binding GntR family transcriptional regulator